MPQISVIVPIYNTEEYLHDCIESILAQTYRDFELILVDDGSSDNSGKICDKYGECDNRIRVIHKENQGAASSRNEGIRRARGKCLCFVDADDLLHPQMLEKLMNALITTHSDIALCNVHSEVDCPKEFWNLISGSEAKKVEVTEKTILEFYKTPFWCWVVWGRLIRTDIVRNKLFVENRYHEDTITIQWLFGAKNIAIVESELYFYRENPQGISKAKPDCKRVIDGIWAVSEQLSYAREKGYKELEKRYVSRFLYESAKAFFVVKEENKKLARSIKKRAFSEWWKYRKVLQFKQGEEALVLEMLFPVGMWLYWQKVRISH